tara:strand:+ start:72 stop:998 length:927 start_codon:yes stop_codon:yes gene_type:complete
MRNVDNSMSRFGHILVSELDSKGVYAKDLSDPVGEKQTEIHKFCNAIAKQLRGVKFAQKGRYFWIYYPDELFARGKITYGDERYADDGEAKHTYNVWSPFIQNNKSDVYNTAIYFRLSSVNIKTAVRNAVKYLRMYSPIHVLSGTYQMFRDAQRSSNTELTQKVQSASYDLTGNYSTDKRLFAEFKHMLTSGHKFIHPSFGQDLEKYFNLEQELKDTKTKQEFTFVYVKGVGDDQEIYTTQTMGLPERVSGFSDGDWSNVNVDMTSPHSELTDHLLSRVSVLMPMDNDKFLDDIGYKYCDEVYYVYNS